MSYSFNGRGRPARSRHSFRPSSRSSARFGRRPQQSRINRAAYVSAPLAFMAEETEAVTKRFEDFGLPQVLLANVVRHGYSKPTPIQDQAIPALTAGRDVVGIANTGTGKTAAFLLPLIQKVMLERNQRVLIVAPTRELALQIVEEFGAFTRDLGLGVALCIGGAGIGGQMQRLRERPNFVIGTPGRLKDLINRGVLRAEVFGNIVLDEVDRMLDIGFRRDILFLISKLPKKRQAAFFSATMSQESEKIMRELLTDPVTISVKKRETLEQIQQDVVTIKQGESKVEVLYKMLLQDGFEKVLVFGRTKHGVRKLERQLFERGIRVSSIHGNKSQNARQRSLEEFKEGRVQALLATDVVARGIDIDGVTHVINFDEPMTYLDYVHRIGRTGRAGKMGKALTFVT